MKPSIDYKISPFYTYIYFFVFFLCYSFQSNAQCETISGGAWESPSTWSNCGGSIPTLSSSVVIHHNITSSGNNSAASIVFNDNGSGSRSLTITSGILTVSGNFNTDFGSSVSLSDGATLNVQGTLTSYVAFNIDGTLNVGTLNPQQGTFNVNATGDVNVSGAFTISSGYLVMNIYGDLSANSMSISGGTYLNVKDGGYLDIENDVLHSGNGFAVDEGAVVDIGGDLDIIGGSTIQYMDGYMNVYGNIDMINDGNKIIGNNKGCVYFESISCPSHISNCTSLIEGVCIAVEPLPIELLYLKASFVKSYAQLDWATASELNNDYFTIERSANGVDFEALAIVDGAGTSQGEKKYSWKDFSPLFGKSYYRLKQTDLDKNFSYSHVVSVKNSLQTTFHVFPNPVVMGEVVHIQGHNMNPGLLEYTIFSADGKVVLRNVVSSESSSFSISLEKSLLQQTGTGLYILQIQNGMNLSQQKILIH